MTGFEIANAAIVAALRAEGHVVKVFGFQRPDDPAPDDPDTTVIDRFEIENAAASPGRKLLWIADALRWNLPVAAAKLRAPTGNAGLRRCASSMPKPPSTASFSMRHRSRCRSGVACHRALPPDRAQC